MFLIAGLGNPGRQYERTRHNMGFDAIDELIERHRIPQGGIAHKAMYGKGIIEGEKVILAKPLTYMNLSGDSLREFVNYYKLDPESEMIVGAGTDQNPEERQRRRPQWDQKYYFPAWHTKFLPGKDRRRCKTKRLGPGRLCSGTFFTPGKRISGPGHRPGGRGSGDDPGPRDRGSDEPL